MLDHLLKLDRRVRVTAPSLVEINQRADPEGRFQWISLYKHTGHRPPPLHRPVPITSIAVSLMPPKPVDTVHCLRADRELPIDRSDDGRVTVPRLDLYEVAVFQFGEGA